MNRSLLEQQMAQLPLLRYDFFDPKELEFSHRVRWICERECPRYGKTWACPPGVGSVEDCRARCLAFDTCLLIATAAEDVDVTDKEAALATRRPHEQITDRVAELLRQQGTHPYVLSTEACALCSRCALLDGQPCRFPEKMHPCVESHGINVIPTLERLGLEFQQGSDVIVWISLLFY